MSQDSQYLAPVNDATSALNDLYITMLEQLDPEQHGFGWWHGYTDQRRLALISEYLLASVSGVSQSLGDAAFIHYEFKQNSFSDDHWVRSQLQAAQTSATTSSDFLRALRRSGNDERRSRRLRLGREHIFYHLAQAFDRLAAVIVGVAALDTQIIRADWRIIEDERRWRSSRGRQSDVGRKAQEKLRDDICRFVNDAGPPDWLRWIEGTRNNNAHRAPKTDMIALSKERRGVLPRLVHLFDKQPTWSLTEAMVGTEVLSFNDVWLLEEPLSIVEGLLKSVSDVVEDTIDRATALWNRRKADPRLLVQPGGQWPRVLEEPQLSFPGYGKQAKLTLEGGAIHVAPETARRMRAAGVFSREFWEISR